MFFPFFFTPLSSHNKQIEKERYKREEGSAWKGKELVLEGARGISDFRQLERRRIPRLFLFTSTFGLVYWLSCEVKALLPIHASSTRSDVFGLG